MRFEKTLPTFGFNNESTHRAGFDIDLYDLGGGKRIRGIWKAYMADVHGCIFVVDSADEDRIAECREVFAETLRDPHLSGKPIVVFANKQDLPEAKSAAEVAEDSPLHHAERAASHRRVHSPPRHASRRRGRERRPRHAMDAGKGRGGLGRAEPAGRRRERGGARKEEALKRERVKRGEQARRERLEAEASAAAAAADAKEDAKADAKAEAPGTPAQGEADESSTPIGGSASPTSLSPLAAGPGGRRGCVRLAVGPRAAGRGVDARARGTESVMKRVAGGGFAGGCARV